MRPECQCEYCRKGDPVIRFLDWLKYSGFVIIWATAFGIYLWSIKK